ncbi:MAG: AMP-binding protein [Xanthomonadales bacterium]|nr:AMP-binding protein [Xanthomonadales bacterium]
MAQRIWHKSYSPGIPHEIDVSGLRSIAQLFHEAVARYGGQPAFTNFGTTLSFTDVARLSRDFGAYLQQELGVRKGDRVAMMAPNTLGFVVGMFGVIRAGGVQVNVNPLYSPRELRHQLKDADADTIIIFSGSTGTLAEVIADTPVKNVIVFGLDDLVGRGLPSPPIDGRLSGAIDFVAALGRGAELGLDEAALDHDDALYLQYTGGTTGLSKGAELTHRNLVANILQVEATDTGVLVEGKEVVMTAIPLYHIYALMVNTLYAFRRGWHNVLITNPRDMASFVKTWAATRPSLFTGVNTLYNGLLHTPGFRDLDFSGFKVAFGGGAAIQQAVSERWREVTGNYIKEGYGLSETSPVLTFNPIEEKVYRSGIGLPLPSTDLSLRDDAGKEVSPGEPGEIWAKGPQVMRGYWRQADATAQAMTADGYFKTGDIGVMDADGYFRIVDRKKDMILVSGFNVYPNEIEEEVAGMPGVLESACIGVPDEATGEAVKLFVVRSDPALTAEDVRDFCRPRLAAYKVPKQIEFRAELPKSAVGKILRRELR